MTEYQRWLREQGVEYETGFTRGYALMGKSLSTWAKENQRIRKNGGKPPEVREYRWEAIGKFSFAIPNEEALRVIGKYAPILEVGAGSGYWAHELRKIGVDIIATDPHPYKDYHVKHDDGWPWERPVEKDAADSLVEYPNRTLMMVWPAYDAKWPAEALKAYTGRHVIYVGEGPGGCTADDEFHDVLENQFDQVEEVCIPQWWGIHDCLWVYRRK